VLDVRYLRKMIDGVPVVAAPAEIDVTVAEELRAVLLAAGSAGHPTVVVDMTRTVFCDSSGVHTLLRAHKRAVAEGGELRLVLPPDGAVPRIMTLTCLDRFIPCFPSLAEALARPPAAHPIQTALTLQNSRMPCQESSRPCPDCLTPPNGSSG
jgi:anti-sigma B factor antagonist